VTSRTIRITFARGADASAARIAAAQADAPCLALVVFEAGGEATAVSKELVGVGADAVGKLGFALGVGGALTIVGRARADVG
jgi:hypothetical protein